MTITKRQFLWAGAAGLLALAAGVITATQQSRQSNITKGNKSTQNAVLTGADKLWELTFDTPSQKPLVMAQLKGKPLLINFWATWCAPCVEEMPRLQQFYQAQIGHSAKRFELLGIAADKAESVVKFLEKTPVTFPITLAGFDGIALSQSLGNTQGGLPYSILLDEKGALLFKKEGQLTSDDLKMIKNLLVPS